MNYRFIINDFIVSFKQWIRSRGTVFWTLLFPILLILIFGAIFSGTGDITYNLYVQDNDDSISSTQFIGILENISVLNIETIDISIDIKEYMKVNDISTAIMIPKGFEQTIFQYKTNPDDEIQIDITFFYDPSEQSTMSVMQNILSSTIYEYNLILEESHKVIGINQETTLQEDFSYIDFFIPGIIGLTIMNSCIYGSIERNTKFRKAGILRKMLTMPVSRTEWIIAKMLFMLFLSFLSTFVILIFGIFVWDLSIHITIFAFILVIATSFMFSGMGMIISRFVKDEETADMAGGAISFPMMFLAGTFFPLEQMDHILQIIAQVLPLYYVNEGLRNAMVYANFDKALWFTGIVSIFAIVFFMAGALLTKWDEN